MLPSTTAFILALFVISGLLHSRVLAHPFQIDVDVQALVDVTTKLDCGVEFDVGSNQLTIIPCPTNAASVVPQEELHSKRPIPPMPRPIGHIPTSPPSQPTAPSGGLPIFVEHTKALVQPAFRKPIRPIHTSSEYDAAHGNHLHNHILGHHKKKGWRTKKEPCQADNLESVHGH